MRLHLWSRDLPPTGGGPAPSLSELFPDSENPSGRTCGQTLRGQLETRRPSSEQEVGDSETTGWTTPAARVGEGDSGTSDSFQGRPFPRLLGVGCGHQRSARRWPAALLPRRAGARGRSGCPCRGPCRRRRGRKRCLCALGARLLHALGARHLCASCLERRDPFFPPHFQGAAHGRPSVKYTGWGQACPWHFTRGRLG